MQRACALAEKKRLAVRGLALPQAPDIGGVVTFSAGVATAIPGPGASGARALVEAADGALYAAKAAGRDMAKTQSSFGDPLQGSRAPQTLRAREAKLGADASPGV